MKNTIQIVTTTLITFAVYFFVDEAFFKLIRKELYDISGSMGFSHVLTYMITGVPFFIGTLIISKKESFLTTLGLKKPIVKAFLFSLLCCLPLFIGFSVVFEFNTSLSLDDFLIRVFSASFFEELYFRAFLFGILYKFTKLGFVPSVLIGAIYFGLLHLHQSTEVMELVGIFAVTFVGAIIFAWAFSEWKFNIWIPVFLHMLMNLSWEIFDISDNALGSLYPNILRLTTIVLIFGLTIWYKKANGLKMEITRRKLWMKA